MISRILWVLLYYLAGFLLAWIVYEAEDTHYAHGPGPRELVVFITMLGGLIWFVVAIGNYIKDRSVQKKGAILAHLTVFVACAIFIFFTMNTPSTKIDENFEIVVEARGDTTVMRHAGNLIYYKVGDSVLINFIDSTQIDWSKVKYIKEPF